MRPSIRWALGLAILAAGTPSLAGKEEVTHEGRIETKTFTIRYRPGSRAGAAAERWSLLAPRMRKRIAEQLEFDPPDTFSLFLYDSVAELQSITGVAAGGYSTPLTSHVPHDNEQTAYHELVHVFAERFPKAGDEKRNLFSAEGLANALLVHVDDVHVHAQARTYRDRKKLPALREMLGASDFYAWMRAHPGFKAYDVAGSFFRFLLDEFGAEGVRRYYAGTPFEKAFGSDLRAAEKAWHKVLDAHEIRPETARLIARQHGEPARFTHYETDPEKRLPPEVRGEPSDWKSVSARPAGSDAKLWTFKDGVYVGSGDGNRWVTCDLGRKKYKDCALQARIALGGPVQIRLGSGCQAMYMRAGTFVYSGDAPVASTRNFVSAGSGEVHLTLVRRGTEAIVYVDGDEALRCTVAAAPTPIGLGLHGRETAFRNVKVRVLD